jgi:hypothetical protein
MEAFKLESTGTEFTMGKSFIPKVEHIFCYEEGSKYVRNIHGSIKPIESRSHILSSRNDLHCISIKELLASHRILTVLSFVLKRERNRIVGVCACVVIKAIRARGNTTTIERQHFAISLLQKTHGLIALRKSLCRNINNHTSITATTPSGGGAERSFSERAVARE